MGEIIGFGIQPGKSSTSQVFLSLESNGYMFSHLLLKAKG